MSCYEWEQGVFKLPTAEFARVRKAVQEVAAKRAQSRFDHAQKFWKGLPAKAKRDMEAYRQAVDLYCYGNRRTVYRQGSPTPGLEYPDLPESAGVGSGSGNADADELRSLLDAMKYQRSEDGRRSWTPADKPRRVLKEDVDFPTNRTASFAVGDGASIVFDRDRSTVTWDVPENNHACDGAREQPLARALFKTLDGVRWTRGTGGEIVGNDEYSRDDRESGGGGNYTKGGYGPLGDPMRHFPKAARSGGQSRVNRGVPSGGQFAYRRHGESSTQL